MAQVNISVYKVLDTDSLESTLELLKKEGSTVFSNSFSYPPYEEPIIVSMSSSQGLEVKDTTVETLLSTQVSIDLQEFEMSTFSHDPEVITEFAFLKPGDNVSVNEFKAKRDAYIQGMLEFDETGLIFPVTVDTFDSETVDSEDMFLHITQYKSDVAFKELGPKIGSNTDITDFMKSFKHQLILFTKTKL